MAFLAPLAAPLAKAGAGIGASLLGNLFSKAKPNDQEKQVLSNDAAVQKTGLQNGQNLLGMGTGAFQPVLNYWSGILSGNRGAMTSAMAPELLRIGEGYDTAAKTSAALNPRGGPSASFLANLPFQRQRDVTTLLQGARPAAAQNLSQAGSNLLSAGTNSLYGSTAAGRDILSTNENLRRLEAERGSSIGKGIFDIVQKYGFPQIDKILSGIGKPATGGVS